MTADRLPDFLGLSSHKAKPVLSRPALFCSNIETLSHKISTSQNQKEVGEINFNGTYLAHSAQNII
jgi:hypothetical protein